VELPLSELNWLAVLVSVIAGQVISTVWFVVLFGDPWAAEYGAADKKQHTKEVPGYTYGVQALCTIVMVITLAILFRWLAVDSAGEALTVGGLVGVGFCVATGVPGQAFLKRWRVAALAFGCQFVMVLAAALILGLWPA